MSEEEGNRNNPYSFDDYLLVRDSFNFYQDDDFFQALVKKYVPSDEFDKIDKELNDLSNFVSYRWRVLADEATRLENRMKCTLIQHFDAWNHRIDRINRSAETEELEHEIFQLGLFDRSRNTPWSRFVKMFLLYEIGEIGVMCPIACTHGLISLLEEFKNSIGSEAEKILHAVRDGYGGFEEGIYEIGAQFLSEIQGGSDVPSNLVEAVYEEGEGKDGYSNVWRIYGQKFFCSAIQADYAVVTAKPKDTSSSTKVGIFVVPSWLPGNKEKEIRNSHTIDRLKQKLGTAELPTAEVTYNGAVAYPIGPLEKGLANVVGIVLSLSRVHVAMGMAAAGLRVAREATLYAQFRTAFGVPIEAFPLMKIKIQDLNKWAKMACAGAFKVYCEFIRYGEKLVAGIRGMQKIEDLEERKRRFRLRELIMLQKIVVADQAPEMVRLAISFYGGHGIMEDFLSAPRFHRDSMIMELWEGPRSVLLTQIHRDLQRVSDWYSPEDFLKDLLAGATEEQIAPFLDDFVRIMNHDSLLRADDETLQICRDWERISNEIFNLYQEIALDELNYEEKPLKFRRLLRKFKKREIPRQSFMQRSINHNSKKAPFTEPKPHAE